MLKKRRILLLVIIAVASVLIVTFWVKRPKSVPVSLVSVDKGEVARTVTNTRAGTLKACRRARLSPSIGGQIANLPVHEGDRVEQGQVLFEIWNNDLTAQLQLAESEAKSSRARAKQACVQSDVAQREAKRLRKLLAKGLTSDEKADQAISHAKAQKAACDAALANAETSQSRIAVARAALDRSRLTAPFAGTIAEVNGELGEYVTPSPIGIPTPPAVDLIDTSCLYVSAPIDEVDAPEIKPDMVARISLDAFSKQFFEGKVRRIAPYVLDQEKQARTVDIEVYFLSKDVKGNMLPGYSADVEVILDTRTNTLRIPTDALLEGGKVYLYDAEEKIVVIKTIKTGLSNWRYTEVTEGLTVGDQIVRTIDREGLTDGVKVSIEKNNKKK